MIELIGLLLATLASILPGRLRLLLENLLLRQQLQVALRGQSRPRLREALDWLLVLNNRNLRCILKEYVEHYNRARPHRSLELGPPTGDPPLGDRDGQVVVMTRLG